MKTRSVFLLSAVFICAIVAPRPAAAMVSIEDFQGTVQGAETIVRATVTGVAKAEFDRAAHVVTLKVEKAIAGRADPEIRLFHGTSTGYEPARYRVGEEYYLCLVPAAYFETGEQPDNFKGMYGEANSGYTKIPVKGGNAVMPKRWTVPDYIKPMLADLSTEHFEAVLIWVRGPTLTARPAKEVFQCDEPMELEITLTNPSPLPMRLMRGSREGFRAFFNMTLRDASGFKALAAPLQGAGNPDGTYLYSSIKDMEASEVLAPGASLKGTARFDIRLAEYRQDPQCVRTLGLEYAPNMWGEAVKDGWRGSQCARVPVRIACPYRAWAEGLRRQGGEWAVSVFAGAGNWSEAAVAVVSPRQGVWVMVRLHRPDPSDEGFDRRSGLGEGMGLQTLSDEERRALAACIRVELQGKAVPGPAPDEKALQGLLSRFLKESASGGGRASLGFACPLNLAEFFDLKAPGQYRARLILPVAGGPSLSNAAILTVPDAAK